MSAIPPASSPSGSIDWFASPTPTPSGHPSGPTSRGLVQAPLYATNLRNLSPSSIAGLISEADGSSVARLKAELADLACAPAPPAPPVANLLSRAESMHWQNVLQLVMAQGQPDFAIAVRRAEFSFARLNITSAYAAVTHPELELQHTPINPNGTPEAELTYRLLTFEQITLIGTQYIQQQNCRQLWEGSQSKALDPKVQQTLDSLTIAAIAELLMDGYRFDTTVGTAEVVPLNAALQEVDSMVANSAYLRANRNARLLRHEVLAETGQALAQIGRQLETTAFEESADPSAAFTAIAAQAKEASQKDPYLSAVNTYCQARHALAAAEENAFNRLAWTFNYSSLDYYRCLNMDESAALVNGVRGVCELVQRHEPKITQAEEALRAAHAEMEESAPSDRHPLFDRVSELLASTQPDAGATSDVDRFLAMIGHFAPIVASREDGEAEPSPGANIHQAIEMLFDVTFEEWAIGPDFRLVAS